MGRLAGLSDAEYAKIVPEGTFLLGYRGSIAHGTYVPQSDPNSIDDKDILGVCVASLDTYFGLKHFEQREKQYKEWDSVVYEVRKFVRLLEGCNPNLFGLLWLEPQHYIVIEPAGKLLLDHRDIFTSRKAYYAFTGYAYGQLKRMTHLACKGYMGAKRKQLVEQHGYDTKNAAHLIRLLQMGIEFLKEGELHVYRHDAQELLEIKRGKYSLEQVQQRAAELFKRAEAVYDACTLPKEPNRKLTNQLLMDIMALQPPRR